MDQGEEMLEDLPEDLLESFPEGFLRWVIAHPEEGLPASEPTTLETVLEDFEKAIYSRGGDLNTVRRCFETLTHEMFGCTSSELFQSVDVPRGDFLALPNFIQKAYIAALFSAECGILKRLPERPRATDSQ